MQKISMLLLCLMPCTLVAQQYLNIGPLPSPIQNEGRLSISGSLGELSFLSRVAPSFVESPTAGERWSIYNSSNSLKFWSGGDKMILTYDGKLGLGISPTFKLDVEGSTRIKNSATALGSYTTFRIQGPDYANGLEIDYFGNNNYSADPALSYGGGAGSAAIINVSPKPLTLGTSNKGRMIIDAVGNVGIGNYNPQVKLDIGSSHGDGLQFRNDASTNYRIRLSPYWSDHANTRLDFDIERQASAGFTTVMSVGYNNNVGIGTTTPDAKLAVKGDIHTQEVKVDLTGAVAPDYVFEKDYSLLPLSEVEAYINANKHLPEVPSAKEMEANGLNLKEMNLLLLKKVEELTLHLIEQNKKLQDMDSIRKELHELKLKLENKE